MMVYDAIYYGILEWQPASHRLPEGDVRSKRVCYQDKWENIEESVADHKKFYPYIVIPFQDLWENIEGSVADHMKFCPYILIPFHIPTYKYSLLNGGG